ncbi:acyl-CoA dehydrogenase family protein [Actinomadura algeriensis]|uniref:Alkylation response protein AidB-like acyl-CoA dehydrogenase n=1 Tax=Actinomadura algeriensis TaxID=1679523 RepID=A0ABR9JJX8_9ACTN|nr:acyl-CoA dehydrogenase family protein [Actinomadura algeriensis]MBE1530445.1 alkylation response protein AidB-like acyl-CoA dehydrogenase [Actinomadura algeriensis]
MWYGDDVAARVRALAPALTERARAAEEARRLPDETIEDLAATGLFSTLVPKRFGGAELGFAPMAAACREAGAACASTGWLSAIYTLHNWMVALFPEETQAEVWADRPYALIPCTLAPSGTAEPSDGGYTVTGRWSWGSGVMHADHVMVMALVTANDTIEPRLFLLPRADVTVHDVWHTSGMRGTGSNDIEVAGAFVPAHRSVPLSELAEGRSPGARVNPGAVYRTPLVPVFALTGAAPVLGAAEGVLARFGERMRGRVMSYTGERQRDLMSGQIRLAAATADLRAARLLLEDALRDASGADAADRRRRANARLAAAHVSATARRVVNDLCGASGASTQLLDSPFQRAQRDVNTISGHVVFDPDASYSLYGKIELGIDPGPINLL